MKVKLTETVELSVRQCVKCGIPYAFSDEFEQRRREDHEAFYCPNGHSAYYPQDNEAERLRKEVEKLDKDRDALRKRLTLAEEMELHNREEREKAERSLTATKGHLTRLKKTVAAGKCPCCRRNFQNLQRHMKTQHAGYADEGE